MGYAKYITKREAVEAFFFIIMLPYNFDWLDDSIRRLTVLFDMGNLIMSGEIIVFGQYDKNDKLVGIVNGVIKNDVFFLHVFSVKKSGCNIAELGHLTELEIKKEFPDVKKMVGIISQENRAAKYYALRNKFKNLGIIKDHVFTAEGKLHTCIKFEKEM